MGRTLRALSVKSKNSAKWHKGAIRAPDGIDAVLPSSAGCGEQGVVFPSNNMRRVPLAPANTERAGILSLPLGFDHASQL
jgi:hypothetical protein